MISRCVFLTLALLVSPLCPADVEAAIDRVLDTLHARAAEADFDGYFELYHEDAVFLGTDRSEYWTVDELRAYAKPHFEAGTGWTYRPLERHVHVAGDTAWFEERLEHARYGETRGTGVLLRTEAGWRVVQYHLTLPIPNELFPDVARRVIEHYRSAAR